MNRVVIGLFVVSAVLIGAAIGARGGTTTIPYDATVRCARHAQEDDFATVALKRFERTDDGLRLGYRCVPDTVVTVPPPTVTETTTATVTQPPTAPVTTTVTITVATKTVAPWPTCIDLGVECL